VLIWIDHRKKLPDAESSVQGSRYLNAIHLPSDRLFPYAVSNAFGRHAVTLLAC